MSSASEARVAAGFGGIDETEEQREARAAAGFGGIDETDEQRSHKFGGINGSMDGPLKRQKRSQPRDCQEGPRGAGHCTLFEAGRSC